MSSQDRDRQSLARRIAIIRTCADLTQQQLADALGVSVDTVQRWETGKRLPELKWRGPITAACRRDLDALPDAGWADVEYLHAGKARPAPDYGRVALPPELRERLDRLRGMDGEVKAGPTASALGWG